MKRVFTLRKGQVIKKISSTLYLFKDCYTGKEMSATISGKQFLENFSLEIGDISYIVVPLVDMTRGRILNHLHFKSEGALGLKQDKYHLDNGCDPLLKDNYLKLAKKIWKKYF